jgi:nucleoside-diphosphate-sugar epimerase
MNNFNKLSIVFKVNPNGFRTLGSRMNVLIIGGNRFFGKKLSRALIQDGHNVTLLNRGSLNDGLGNEVTRIKCDRTNSTELQKAVGNSTWDLVYDQVCYTAKEAQEAQKVFDGKVSHYIFTSSQSVYEPNENIDESFFDPYTYNFEKQETKESNYAEAKRQCEATFFDNPSFPVTAVRFPIVLGADDYTERLLFHIKKVMNGEEIHFPDQDAKISFISSDDAAMVLRFLGDQNAAVGPINAAAEKPIALMDFIQIIEEAIGKKAVFADAATNENHSPYGIEQDWFMNVQKLKSMDCTPAPIKNWLKDEIQSVIQSSKF